MNFIFRSLYFSAVNEPQLSYAISYRLCFWDKTAPTLPTLTPRTSPTLSPLPVMPQRSTCSGLRIRTPSDARTVFHAVAVKVLPMITRRLDSDERNLILPGNVYVWEERGASTESTGVRLWSLSSRTQGILILASQTGIERWTDGWFQTPPHGALCS